MFGRKKSSIALCVLYILFFSLSTSSIILAQDETNDAKIIERYKLMLIQKPKEGSVFDRLYQFYLEGPGLDAMVTDYNAEAQANPNNSNVQLILGHLYKRLGKDTQALTAYQRAVELSQNNYYPHFALGKMYATQRQHENAIVELTKAVELTKQVQSTSPEELTEIYKVLGRSYFRRDKVEEAISTWSKIAELDLEDIFARIELADLFHEQKLYPQAIAQHQAILEIKKDDPYRRCLSLREIGKIHEDTGTYEAARKHYDEALALTAPGNWLRKDLQQRIIGIYAADGNWEGLITYYQNKLETTPNEPELLGLLASAYIENQQLDESITTYRKGLELAPTDSGLRLNLITALRNAEKLEEAATEYEVLTEQQPDDFGIYRELGKLYVQLANVDKAKAVYQRMIDRDPQNASTHLILAEIYTGHEWMEDAVTAYQNAISLAPDNLDFIEYFGEFYFRQGNREQAVQTWNQMVADNKSNAENHDRLARLLGAKKFPTQAIEASRKAVELMPNAYRYREALAKRLMENQEYEDALTEYAEAEKLAPNAFFAEQMGDQRIEIYRRQGTLLDQIGTVEEQLKKQTDNVEETFALQMRLAKMYLKLGNITYGLEVLLEAKALRPDHIVVNRRLAEVYTQQNRQDDANAIYTHLIEIDSANAREYYANIARAHLNTMDFEAATEAAKQVVAHSPRNPEGHQLLAQIAKGSGNYDTAIASLKQAIRLRTDATDIRTELASIYKLSGNLRQALDQYWQCWKLSDSVSDKLAFVKPLSELYYDLGQHNEFQEKLKQLSKVDTSSVAPVLALANIYEDIGDLSNAKFQLARALDRQSDNQELLEQLVKINTDLGNIDDALNYQQQLVKAHPNAVHQQKLGELLYDAGREQEAVQAWTKLIHAKNQTLEAEIKLSNLLIRHGLLEEALLTLDRAGEKATDAKDIYKIGAMLVEMNELERAEPHFQRILEMPTPQTKPGSATTTTHIPHATPYMPYAFTTINMGKLNLPRNLLNQIQRQPHYYSGRSTQTWQPNSFEDAQAGALVQLTTIAQKQGKLNKLIEQYETNAAANPKDIKTLETLFQIYTLFNNSKKVNEITEQLLSISPNDPAYQRMRLNQLTQQKIDYETWKTHFDKMTALTPGARTWLAINYASISFYTGRTENAEKVLSELENMKVTDLNAGLMLVPILAELGKMDQAEKMLAQIRIPVNQANPQTSPIGVPYFPMQRHGFHSQIYSTLAIAYLNNGQTEKAIELFWMHLERTKPKTTNSKRVSPLTYASYSSGGYTPVQSSFPSPTIYYNQDRLRSLQQFFNTVLIKNQQEVLYSKLQAELDASNGRDRMYPGLALSYCYWWAAKRNKAQEMLSALQKEFTNDLSLKLNTCFVSMNVGEHKTALTLLKELVEADPRNRRQYNQMMFQLAVYTGDTVIIRELMTKLLNSPSGTRELYQFSQKLQNAGLTQFALAVAKKAVDMSKGERDPNFLMQLSRHLEKLGRQQDAAQLAERALRFGNQRDRYGQTLHQWNMQHASRLIRNTSGVQNREPKLLEAAENNPNSFRAQLNLANFYERNKQYQNASKAYEAALALRPKDSTVRQQYAQMLQQSGDVNKAVDQYNILIKENPSALGYNSHRVIDAFSNAGKINELVSYSKEMIAPSFGSFGQGTALSFAQGVAQHLLRHNNPKAAVEIYEKIIKVIPNNVYLYTQLISAYENVGETEKAMQLLRESMENTHLLNATQPFAQVEFILKLIELYKKSGKLKELATEYEVKLAEKPNDPLLIFPVALIKIGLNDLEGSDPLVEQLFKNTLLIANLEWANLLAEAYKSAGDRDREIHVLEIATQKVNPQNSWGLTESYRKLGTAYMQKGEKTKGQDTFRKMGAILMSGGGTHGYWEKERLAQTFMQYAMWDDAEALFTDISNNLSANQSSREQAQRQLMMIKQMQRGLTATTQSPQKTQNMNIGSQKALAQQHTRNNKIKEAIQIDEQIVKQMPEDFESRSQLASLYSRERQHDKALKTWEALLKADPENSRYQDGLINAYRASGKISEALELAQNYLTAEPQNSAHHARIARLYSSDGQVEKAIDAYKKSIELKPGDRQIYENLARLYTQNNEFDAAEETYKEAIKFAERDWDKEHFERQLMDLYRRQGKLEEVLKDAEEKGTLTLKMQTEIAKQYKDKGESQKAITAYQKALTLATQDHERRNISLQLMAEYAKLGEDKSVLELFETAYNPNSISLGGKSIRSSGMSITAIRFGNDSIRDDLIKTYQDQGKLDKLQSFFEERLKSKPRDIAALQILSDIYRRAHKHKKAAEISQTLSEVQSNNIRSYYYAAAALNKTGQPELAKQFLNRGEAAFSSSNYRNDMLVHVALAIICLEGEMPDQAVKYAEQAVTKGSGGDIFKDGAYGLLGRCYFETKQYEEAANAYQQLANITRSDWKRKEAEKAIQRAYREGNLHETRIPKLVKMAEENPDDPDVRLSLAKSYESSDQVDEAIKQYEKLIELQPDTSEWHKTIGDLYQRSRETHGTERLAKVTAAYQKAIKLEPNTYQLYEKLGQIYTQGSELEQAESVYRRALDAQLNEYEYNRIISAIWALYDSQKQQEKGIAVLEELKPKMPTSSTLHELLADAYKNVGNTEKSELVRSQWLEIRQKQVNKRQYHRDFNTLAEQLLNLNIYPEVALDYAQRAIKTGDNPKYGLTLGMAHLANEQYDEALAQLKSSLNTIKPKDMENQLLSRISAFGKNAQDKERFTEMVAQLINAISDNSTNELKTNLALAKFCREHGLTEIAKTYIDKTGFIPESAWLFLGPFDNTKGVGYNTTYIPENEKQFDTTTKYDGINGKVSWQKIADETYDGFIDFGADDNWHTGYALTTIFSPDERKAQFLFDSDDQGKIWLNGKKMYAHRRNRGAVIDRRAIPVTLVAGKNTILVKVCNETLPWGFYLRITDSDGNPFKDLKFNNSEEK